MAMTDAETGTSAPAAAELKGPRLKRPQKPDVGELRQKTEKLTKEIDKYADRIKEIKGVLQARRGDSNGSAEEQVLIRKLSDLRSQFQLMLKQKQGIRDELNRTNQNRETLRTQVREMKDKYKFTTVGEIDNQIKRLEDKLNHTTMSANEERQAIDQIRELAKSKETVRSFEQRLEKMQEDGKLREDLIARLQTLDQKLDDIKSHEGQLRDELAEVKGRRLGENQDLAALKDEKQECWEVMCALRDKRQELRNDFSAKMDEFKELDEAWKKQKNEDRKKRDEQRKAEYEERQAHRQARVAEQQVTQQDLKVMSCDQLLAYLNKYVESKEKETKSLDVKTLEPQEGMKLLKKDDQEEMAGWFGGMGDKKKSKGKKNKKQAKEEKPEDKKLMHTLDILQAFHKLQIAVPNVVSEVPKAIEAVQAKKKEFEEKNAGLNVEEPAAEAEKKVEKSKENGKTEENGVKVDEEPSGEENKENAEDEGENVGGQTGEDDFPSLTAANGKAPAAEDSAGELEA